MTRHLATLRLYQVELFKVQPPMLVPPNGLTHELAINQGLDCTLSQHTNKIAVNCANRRLTSR